MINSYLLPFSKYFKENVEKKEIQEQIFEEVYGRFLYKEDNFFYILSCCYDLPEDFIEKYFDKLNKWMIFQCQKLSEKFIEKYKNKIEVNFLQFNDNIPREIKRKYNIEYDKYLKLRLSFREKNRFKSF